MRPKSFRLTPVLIALLAAGLFSFDLWRDYRLRLFPGLYGFAKREPFSLLDSLPALSPGLSNLEAYKITADTSSPTNADRSVWLADSVGEVNVEFYSAKRPLDSVMFYVWSAESGIWSRTLKKGNSLRWNIPVRSPIQDWTEVVGLYISRPPFLNLRSGDSTVRFFERIEGKTIHIVRRKYRGREEKLTVPDTSYSTSMRGELQLMSRGSALAILNPSPATIRLRVIHTSSGKSELCVMQPLTINIYRTLLKEKRGPVLAFTRAGQIQNSVNRQPNSSASFYWLEPLHTK